MRKAKPKLAAVRIDGGRRVDLKQLRERRRKAREDQQPQAPVEDSRVADTWARQAARDAAAQRSAVEQKKLSRLLAEDGGKDGTEIASVPVKLPAGRSQNTAMRCRPGSFEWRYGRKKQNALFHAGSHLALLWERGGMAVASSADFLRGTTSGYRTGIADGRVVALQKVAEATTVLGQMVMSRLVDYCVAGMTTAEIARKHQAKERDMAPVLHHDLRACAIHFKFLGKSR